MSGSQQVTGSRPLVGRRCHNGQDYGIIRAVRDGVNGVVATVEYFEWGVFDVLLRHLTVIP